MGLLQVGHDIAVGQHCALRHTSGPSGVLEVGEIVMGHGHRHQPVGGTATQGIAKAHVPRQVPGRHHLLHMAHHQVNQQGFRKAEHVSQPGDDHVTHRCAGHHLLKGMSEVLHDHDRLATRIPKLMLKLPGGVQRIHIDHSETRAQHREHGDRVLQAVGHHQCHPGTFGQFQLTLEIACKLP